MKRFDRYELRKLIQDGPIKTYRAEEIASGRPVYLHLLTDAMDAPSQETLLKRVTSLKQRSLSSGSNTLLETGAYAGSRYVVTAVLESFRNLRDWVDSHAKDPRSNLTPETPERADDSSRDAGDAPPTPGSVSPTTQEIGATEPQVGSFLEQPASEAAPQETENDPSAELYPTVAGLGGNGSTWRDSDEATESKVSVTAPLTTGSDTVGPGEPLVETAISPAEDVGRPGAIADKPSAELTSAADPPDLRQAVSGLGEQEGLSESPPAAMATSSRDEHEAWSDLARRDLENQAYHAALGALENVESLEPNDSRAAETGDERKGRESEASRQTPRESQAQDLPAFEPRQLAAGVAELKHHAHQTHEQTDRAMLLLSKTQELCDEVRHDEGLDLLRRAHDLDTENPLIKTMLVNALFQRACGLAETDCEAADLLVKEVLGLQPHYPPAKDLREQIAGRKREEHVFWCLVQARRMKKNGDLAGACSIIREGLSHYPGEPRLTQYLAIHAPEQAESQTHDISDQDLHEIALSAEEIVADPSLTGEAGPADPTEEIAEVRPNDEVSPSQSHHLQGAGHVESDFRELEQSEIRPHETPEPISVSPSTSIGESSEPEAPMEHLTGAPNLFTPDEAFAVADVPASNQPQGPSVGEVSSTAEKAAEPPTTDAKEIKTERKPSPLPKYAGIAAAAALVAVSVAFWIWRSGHSEPAPLSVVRYQVQVESSPLGAQLMVNGEPCGTSTCELELATGSHEVEAELAGYGPASITFEIGDQGPANAGPIVVPLSPLPTVFRVSSDLGTGEVSLDGKPIGKLEDGEFDLELEGLAAGEHALAVSDRGSSLAMSFEAVPGSPPAIRLPVETRSLKAVVIAGLGPSAQVYSDSASARLSLDSEVLGEVGADGFALTGLAQGPHELVLEAGRDRRKILFDSSPGPTLAAYLSTDRNIGSLRIATGEDGATIYLNGTKYRRQTQRGQRLIYLYPKQYSVRVEKEGFRSPPEQLAEVQKGEESRLNFELVPLPRFASLQVRNGLLGTKVVLDGTSLGEIPPSGTLSVPQVDPGKHTILLEKALYQPRQIERDFVAGGTVEVDGSLEQKLGRLRINVTPPDAPARLTLRREGETVEKAISGTPLDLPQGTYTVTARAAGYHDFGATLRVDIDQTKVANLVLKPRVEERKPPQPALGMADWAKTSGWNQEGNVLVRRGGKFVLAPGQPEAGTYAFSARLMKGRRLEWVVNYVDSDNYLLYEIGKTYFLRTPVANGKKERPFRIPHEIDRDGLISVQIEVSAGSIAHKLRRNDEWEVIERWNDPGADLTSGKFGFHVPGRDEIALSDFSFVPRTP